MPRVGISRMMRRKRIGNRKMYCLESLSFNVYNTAAGRGRMALVLAYGLVVLC